MCNRSLTYRLSETSFLLLCMSDITDERTQAAPPLQRKPTKFTTHRTTPASGIRYCHEGRSTASIFPCLIHCHRACLLTFSTAASDFQWASLRGRRVVGKSNI